MYKTNNHVPTFSITQDGQPGHYEKTGKNHWARVFIHPTMTTGPMAGYAAVETYSLNKQGRFRFFGRGAMPPSNVHVEAEPNLVVRRRRDTATVWHQGQESGEPDRSERGPSVKDRAIAELGYSPAELFDAEPRWKPNYLYKRFHGRRPHRLTNKPASAPRVVIKQTRKGRRIVTHEGDRWQTDEFDFAFLDKESKKGKKRPGKSGRKGTRRSGKHAREADAADVEDVEPRIAVLNHVPPTGLEQRRRAAQVRYPRSDPVHRRRVDKHEQSAIRSLASK